MRNEWLRDRLESLKPLGKSQAGLAEVLGLPRSRVAEMISGTRKIAADEIQKMANYLGLPEISVLALATGSPLSHSELRQVNVIGVVEAGRWRETLEWDNLEQRPDPVPVLGKYSNLPQFGLEVRGPSMNELYPHGSTIVCVSLMDLGRDPIPGERVVCHRRSAVGLEATVKELRQDTKGDYWLWPRSTDPAFQQPWRLPRPDDHAADNEDVRIAALVIGSYRPEP